MLNLPKQSLKCKQKLLSTLGQAKCFSRNREIPRYFIKKFSRFGGSYLTNNPKATIDTKPLMLKKRQKICQKYPNEDGYFLKNPTKIAGHMKDF